MVTTPRTHSEYLAKLSDDEQAALERLRAAIREAAPDAEETISYQLPAFRLNGKLLVGYGATPKHCAFYLMRSATAETHRQELEGYDTSQGTIRFSAEEPLPAALVRRLVRTRIQENSR